MSTHDTVQQSDQAEVTDAGATSHLDLVFEHVGVGLGLLDRDCRFLIVNDELAEMNGVSVKAHLGRLVRDVLPALADSLDPIYQSVLTTGKPAENIHVQGETPAQPGVSRHWMASYYPNRNPDGDVVGLLLVVREVTDEVRMKDALADSQSRLRMAMEGSGLGVWDWFADTNSFWFSDTWQTMLGYEPGELPQHLSTWRDAVHPDDWPVINAALYPHLIGETPHYECEHRVRCKDGSWLWVLDRGTVVKRAADGRALRMVGTHDNIHGRKEAQNFRSALLELARDLAELDNTNRMLDRSLQTILTTLDVDFAAYTETGEGPGYPRMARRWRDGRMGTSQGLWVGVRSYKDLARRLIRGDIVAIEDFHALTFTEVVDIGQSDGEELRGLLIVPVMRHEWMVGTMFAGSKSPRLWTEREIEFLSDVRDRTREAIARAKAGEANLKAQEELQRIGRLNTLSALTSTLAHELNQPLAAASNYLTAAKMQARRCTLPDMDPERTPEHIIELAAQQVVRAGEIIRRMRAFTQSGEVTGRLANVAEVTDGAIETTLASMSPKTLIIRKSYADDLPDVMLDTVQFQQVISNLVRNAIEAMEDVEHPELCVTIRQSDGHIHVDVVDNGPGLGADVLATLFQPFRSEKRRGLGLGLPICRTIIEAHGGKISGAEREGGGALFSISLPVAPTP